MYNETIAFLANLAPVQPIRDVPLPMTLAARDHAADIGRCPSSEPHILNDLPLYWPREGITEAFLMALMLVSILPTVSGVSSVESACPSPECIVSVI